MVCNSELSAFPFSRLELSRPSALRRFYPMHILRSYSAPFTFNIIPPYVSVSPADRFHSCYIPNPFRPPWFNYPKYVKAEPREVNWGATWMKKSSGSRSRKQWLTAVGTRCADHVTPLYPQKLALTSPTGGGRSVGIVRVRTKATEFSLSMSKR